MHLEEFVLNDLDLFVAFVRGNGVLCKTINCILLKTMAVCRQLLRNTQVQGTGLKLQIELGVGEKRP